MLQIVVGLLGIYMGLAISFEQIVKYFFRYSDHDFTKDTEGTLAGIINWFSKTQSVVGFIGFIVGIIIFIAPTPTVQVVDVPIAHVQAVTQRFVGDFIPSMCLIITSIIMNNGILNFFNFKNRSYVNKILAFINKQSFWIGLITIFFGFLHLILGNIILF